VLSVDYDTRSKAPGWVFAVANSPSFGPLWQGSAHKRLVLQKNSTGAIHAVQVSRGGAGWISFNRNAAGSFTPHAGVNDRLIAVSTGWQYFDAASHAIETYDSSGVLTATYRAGGGVQTYSYSTSATPADVAPSAGLLLAVQDQHGRTVQFTYEAGTTAARVRTVIDAGGEVTAATYDTADNLTSLNWSDGRTRRFIYEMTALPWALTGMIDENNDRAGTYGYDSHGRAVSTERGGGVDHYSVSYGAAPAITVSETLDTTANVVRRAHRWQLAGDVVMTTPNQTSVSFGNALVNGTPRVTTRSQPAGAGCDASSSSLAYDANGNVVSKTDFNGTRSCHAHDLSRNLETARLEGLASPEACPADITGHDSAIDAAQRKTTTQWHPDWSLPVKRAEPGKLTVNVYNGQPDQTAGNATASCAPTTAVLPDGKPIVVLCKKVEQATTDATGALSFGAAPTGTPRTWAYSYNEHGQLLTARDPLNNLTTYAYHAETSADYTRGDLQSVTNPAGHTTQYKRYEKSGRLLESVDANGTKTETTYTPRGWVKTVTTTPPGAPAQTTVYDHDGVGQLKKATLSDGTELEYAYDAAHRLRSIKDAAGNSVTYTLDNMGNRTGEELKDAGGTLARNIGRMYDALNRVQSTTGL
jgi:YD repeat-containing protein